MSDIEVSLQFGVDHPLPLTDTSDPSQHWESTRSSSSYHTPSSNASSRRVPAMLSSSTTPEDAAKSSTGIRHAVRSMSMNGSYAGAGVEEEALHSRSRSDRRLGWKDELDDLDDLDDDVTTDRCGSFCRSEAASTDPVLSS